MKNKNEIVSKEDSKIGFDSLLGTVNHSSTVIVCRNKHQYKRILEWCEKNNKDVPKWMYSLEAFPICLGVSEKLISWTDLMDRELFYIEYRDFARSVF